MLADNNNTSSTHPCIAILAPSPLGCHPILNDRKHLLWTQLNHERPKYSLSGNCYTNAIISRGTNTNSTSLNSSTSIRGVHNANADSRDIWFSSQATAATGSVAHTDGAPAMCLFPGPPPGFGPPGFPEPQHIHNRRNRSISPTLRSLHPVDTVPAGAQARLRSSARLPETTATDSRNTLPSALSDVIEAYSGHEIIDYTTNPYVKIFSQTRNVQDHVKINDYNYNNNDNFDCNKALPHRTTEPLHSGLASIRHTSATSLGLRGLFHAGVSHPQQQSLHQHMTGTNNGKLSSNCDGNTDASAHSLQQQYLGTDSIYVNVNEQEHQMHHHDLKRCRDLPGAQPTHWQSSSSMHPYELSSLFVQQQHCLQAQNQSHDNISNVADALHELPAPLSLPQWLPVTMMPPSEGRQQRRKVYGATSTDISLNRDLSHHSGNSSLGESSLPVGSVVDNVYHTHSQFRAARPGGADCHVEHFHQQQQRKSFNAPQTLPPPQRMYNVHNAATTDPQMQQYDEAGVARLQGVNDHMFPRPQVDISACSSTAQHVRSSFSGASVGRSGDRYDGDINNVTLNAIPGSVADIPNICSQNPSLAVPTVVQLDSNCHLLQQKAYPPQEQDNQLSAPPVFPLLPASNLSDKCTQYNDNDHDLYPDMRSSMHMAFCALGSPLVQSECAPVAVARQDQQNVTSATNAYNINSEMDVNGRCNETIRPSRQSGLATCPLGDINQSHIVHRQPQMPSAVGENLQEQHEAAVMDHLNYSCLKNFPAVVHQPTGVLSQHGCLQKPQHDQQGLQDFHEDQFVHPLQPPYEVLQPATTNDAIVSTLQNDSAVASSPTGMTAVANDLVPCNDEDEDGIYDVHEHNDDDDEDEDVIIMNAAADAFIMDTVPDSDNDPQTPPATTVHMRIAMYEHAKAKACGEESSPLNLTLLSPSVPGVPCSSLSSSSSTIDSSRGEERREECGALEISMKPNVAAQVEQEERELRHATDDTFHSSVTWTEASLSQILTLELKNICLKGSARLCKYDRQHKTAMRRHDSTGAVLIGDSVNDNQHHLQEQQRFECFNSHMKQASQLDTYIERLVSYANCSSSALIVMLIYIYRVQQRCENFQLNDLNVHRVVLAALLAAVKFVEDRVYSNAGFAYIGGEDVKELNNLEYVFNQAADWTFFVTGEEYRAFEDGLLQRWTTMNAEGERVVIPPT